MTPTTMHTGGCEERQDDLMALASGSLGGPEREETLAHLETCARCSREVETLSAAVDALIDLIPDAQPPAGFADRVTASFGATRGVGPAPVFLPARARARARWPWERSRPLAIAACVLALAVGVGVGVGFLSSSGGGTSGPKLYSSSLTSSSGVHGSVALSDGHPAWLFVAVDSPAWWGTVTCTVTTSGGGHRVVGHFDVSSGYDSWTVRLSTTSSSVTGVVLTGAGGTLAHTRLAT